MNKYKVLVGAKGIHMKTFGPVEMYGTLVNFTGQQINISSQYETLIDGGDRMSLRARKIAFTPREHSPVLVDGALHVSRNAIVQGGMYVEGQFGTPAIASLREYAETSDAIWQSPGSAAIANEDGEVEETEDVSGSYAYAACGKAFGMTPHGPQEMDVTVLIPPHTHLYERPPSQLFNSLQALRTFFADPGGKPVRSGGTGASINDVKRLTAATPVNDFATGEGAIAAGEYATQIRSRILNVTRSQAPWTQWSDGPNWNVDVSVIQAIISGDRTRVTGIMTARVGDNRTTWTYSITYAIEVSPESLAFVREIERPDVRLVSNNSRAIEISI